MNRKILRLHQSTHQNIEQCISDLKKNPDLKFLILNNCDFLTDEILDYVPNSCSSLDISLSSNNHDSITNTAINKCLIRLKDLEFLNLSGRNNLDDSIFKILPKTLKSIVLPGKNAENVTERALKYLKKLPNLRFLYLNESSFSIDICLHMQSLVHLDLSFNESITDSVFQLIPKNNNLRSLNLHGCTKLTDFSLFSIANKCKKLERFYISDCDNITNNGVEAIILKCEKLTCLTLSKCGKISDNVFFHTIKELNHLQKLNLIGCNNVSSEVLALLRKSKPLLQTYSNEATS